jgi:oligopeptide/dipeptide ABC transporter ATP-binding protein
VSATLLELSDLEIELVSGSSLIRPVRGISFGVDHGEILGIAGESGSGKTLTLRSILGLLPADARVGGERRFSLNGDAPAPYEPSEVRGRGISMVFQDSMTALNPTMRVGDLIAEAPRHHEGLGRSESRRRALELMERVGIPDPARGARMWPHELSGGLRQRVMIAVALSVRPRLLLCDEPTTALDVSVQDQILGLLQQLRVELGMAIVFVSHDLAVLAELCDRLVVMYAGQVMETGPTHEVLARPGHPYTEGLLEALPSFERLERESAGIPGQPPDPGAEWSGCPFAPRCPYAVDECGRASMSLVWRGNRATACIRPEVLRERA